MIKSIIKHGRLFSWRSQPKFSIEKFLESNEEISDEMLNIYTAKASKMSLIKFESEAEKKQMNEDFKSAL